MFAFIIWKMLSSVASPRWKCTKLTKPNPKIEWHVIMLVPSSRRCEAKALITVKPGELEPLAPQYLLCAGHLPVILTKIVHFRHNTQGKDEEWEAQLGASPISYLIRGRTLSDLKTHIPQEGEKHHYGLGRIRS